MAAKGNTNKEEGWKFLLFSQALRLTFVRFPLLSLLFLLDLLFLLELLTFKY